MSNINVAKRNKTTNQVLEVETSHIEIGYTNNVEIIQTALREYFGFDDGILLEALAKLIWQNYVATKCSPCRWGVEEINLNLFIMESATQYIRDRLPAVEAKKEGE